MSKVKVNPRQRFINLMYLVLLAMLALSIPDTVLSAFDSISDNLVNSTQRTKNETTDYVNYFEQNRLKNDEKRNMPAYEKAIASREIIKDLEVFIDSLKETFVTRAGGYKAQTSEINSPENTDITNRFFQKEKNASLLKEKIKAAQQKLQLLFPENQRADLDLKPFIGDGTTSAGKKLSWEEKNFGPETPAVAAYAMLSMFSADAAVTENTLVKKLLGRLDETVLNLDSYMAVATAPTSYVLAGQPYSASVYLTSFDSQKNFSIAVGGQPLRVENGMGKYAVNTNNPGIYNWKGVITVKQADGKVKSYTTPEQTFQVVQPAATISASKMNVLYAGIENPVEIASAGIPDNQLAVKLKGSGSLRKVSSGYEYSVDADAIGQRVTFEVTANQNGKVIPVGKQEFRIKRIKDPIAKVAGKNSGTITAIALRNQGFLFASLDDFEFDIKFAIVRFNVIKIGANRDIVSARNVGADFNAEVKNLLGTLVPGNRVIFDNVVAKGPDGKERLLNSIILNII
jgi:gliding motility-associated protein GldM